MGLSKFLRTKAQRHFQRGQYLIGGQHKSPSTIYIIIYLKKFWQKNAGYFFFFRKTNTHIQGREKECLKKMIYEGYLIVYFNFYIYIYDNSSTYFNIFIYLH